MVFFPNHMAIDLGTVNTLVYVKGRGVVLNEPTVVAMRTEHKEILAVGEDARRMLGRTPGGIVAVRPMKEGVISDYDMTEIMLKYFIKKASQSASPFGMRVKLIVCVPCGITEVEKHAVEGAARAIGARDVFLMEEPVAAAIGAGLNISEAKGSLIVEMGGGTTEIAVISLGGIVVCKSLRTGGNHMDEAIAEYVKKQYNLIIGEMTAEQIKITLGSAYEAAKEEKMTVRGRNVQTGLPAETVVHAAEIKEALAAPVRKILDALKLVMEQTPPELSADIIREGIVISGGTAQLRGLNRLFAKETGIPVRIANDPMACVACGAGLALSDYFEVKRLTAATAQESMV
jgi:rod shape-determining protein MreB